VPGPQCCQRLASGTGGGFAASLLIGGLARRQAGPQHEPVRLAVLISSLIEAAPAAVVGSPRGRGFLKIHLNQERDRDSIPEVLLTGYWVRSWGHISGGEVP
jgi:hypothetical protein